MNKIIETDRLYLRALNINDAKNFYLLNLDKAVLKYTGDKPFDSIESAKNFLKNYDQYLKYGCGRWAVINKENEEFLGWCGLKYTATKNEYDIGFRFFKKHWNKGYATEAAKSCIEYGLNSLNIKEIVGRAIKQNLASIRVLQKIGLIYHQEIDFERNKWIIYKTK